MTEGKANQPRPTTVLGAISSKEIPEDFFSGLFSSSVESLRDLEKSSTRTVGFLLLLMAAFELLGRKATSEFSLLFIKVTDPFLLRVFLPVAVLYLALRYQELVTESLLLTVMTRDMLIKRYQILRDFEQEEIDSLFAPGGSIVGLQSRLYQIDYGRAYGTVMLMYLFRMFGFPLIVIAFEVYAFYQLFAIGTSLVLVIISLVISVILLIVFFSYIFAWFSRASRLEAA